MKRVLALIFLLTSLVPASAQTSPVVVELYTSQGCSSCPPADKLLTELAGRDDVIALGLHVDYWDYIGWKDSFADPAYTQRQRGYAKAAGTRSIYTPQMVVAGKDHVIGFKPMKLAETLAKHASKAQSVALNVSRKGRSLVISAAPTRRIPTGAIIHVVTYEPSSTVRIKRGENAGRTLNYANIVTNWRQVDRWSGKGDYKKSVQLGSASKPVVVIVQEPGHGAILAAARLR